MDSSDGLGGGRCRRSDLKAGMRVRGVMGIVIGPYWSVSERG